MKTMYECKKCGSHDVEIQKWVDPNTNEILYNNDDEEQIWYWCNNCEEHHQGLVIKEVA